jgi:hypothetical protein
MVDGKGCIPAAAADDAEAAALRLAGGSGVPVAMQQQRAFAPHSGCRASLQGQMMSNKGSATKQANWVVWRCMLIVNLHHTMTRLLHGSFPA